MPRSKWKKPFINIKEYKTNFLDKSVKTSSRNVNIIPNMVGKKIGIYNGKDYKEIFITSEMIGKKLGEFSFTRSMKKNIHMNKNKK